MTGRGFIEILETSLKFWKLIYCEIVKILLNESWDEKNVLNL